MDDDAGSLVKAARDAFRGRDWAAARDGFRAVRDVGPVDRGRLLRVRRGSMVAGRHRRVAGRLRARPTEGYLQAGRPPRAAMAAMFLAAHATERGDSPSARAGWAAFTGCSAISRRASSTATRSTSTSSPPWPAATWTAPSPVARRMQELGRRFGDPNLVALGVLGEGRALLKQGRMDDGMALLDEAMTAAFSDRAASDLDRGDLLPHDGCLP